MTTSDKRIELHHVIAAQADYVRRHPMAQSRSLRPHSRLRLSFACIVSLMLLVALGSGVAAAPPTIDRHTSSFASAISSECVTEPDATEVCTYLSVDVFSSDSAWTVCIFNEVAIYPPDGEPTFTVESGCAAVTDDSFSVDRKLTSANLDPVTVTIFSYECDEFGCTETSREATISGTWTGTGNLTRFSNKSSFQDGKCTFMFMGKGESRNAIATITLDGQTFQTDDATIASSKSSLKVSSDCS